MKDANNTTAAETDKPPRKRRRPFLVWIGVAVTIALFSVGSYVGYAYTTSPLAIREPLLEHYHFRMQILVNGKAENFGSSAYQIGYAKDQCNANLPEQPIHFHDNKDQFVHIHWEGMTGGLVMKYYGWNYIGGMNDALGYRFDDLPGIKKIPIHGKHLPKLPEGAKLYVYTGDEKGYAERGFEDWNRQDLETFFGKTSNFPAHKQNMQKRSSILDTLFPRAYAHGGHSHTTTASDTDQETEEERLTRINNLIGNVVIFAQKDRPTDAQIKVRFDKLAPLSDSTCGG